MTTGTAKRRAAPSRRSGPSLPSQAGRAVIEGREFILFPSDEFTDWYEDQILAAVAAERLRNERHLARPAEEVFARLDAKRKGK
jgi:hypothetical protein